MHLKKEVESADWFISNIVRQMQGKFDKYWAEYSPVLATAIAFDPRYKLQFIEFYYKKLYEGSFKVELNQVRGNLISLFEEYSRLGSKESTKSDASVNKLIGISDDVTDDIQEFANFESQETENKFSQMDLYLQEPKVPITQDLDILKYWKSHEYRYPELSMMARDILTIPISTVASESTFSIGDRVLDQYRSSLAPENVEALVTTRDWLFGSGVDYLELETEDIVEDILGIENVGSTS